MLKPVMHMLFLILAHHGCNHADLSTLISNERTIEIPSASRAFSQSLSRLDLVYLHSLSYKLWFIAVG